MNGHVHEHQGEASISERKLTFAIFFNLLITAMEIIGGLLSGSLALLSDALHNFTDSTSLWLSLLAQRISRRDATGGMTFGYRRARIMAAFINSSILVAVTLFLFKEAFTRFFNPTHINGPLMIIIASIGLIANLFSVLLLKRDSKYDLNIRSSYLHLVADTLSSIVVVVGGLIMYFFEIYWLDPLLSVLIGLYLLKETWGILSESIHILMQGAPKDISIGELRDIVEGISGVECLHHVHIWQMDDRNVNFEGHVQLGEDINLKEADAIRMKINEHLREMGITHTVIQMEFDPCPDMSLVKKGSCM